ncbi:glycosyltransferase [Halomonas sp.]|uniref:glycosyltransferase n=1 Tax=Halomonas sp. TaxID=1486246 RepID=UPI003F91734E
MERFFSPVATALPSVSRVLVLAPHADDEVFGCGGLLTQLAAQRADIQVVVITQPEDSALASVRKAESNAAAALLGYPAPQWWDFADGALHSAHQALQARLVALFNDTMPDAVLVPSPWEMHRDHRALCDAALAACEQSALATDEHNCQLGFYEIGQPLTPNQLVDITPVLALKEQAMACFVSQHTLQDYSRHISALNAYRSYTLPKATLAAEAFLWVPVAELALFRAHIDPQRLSGVTWNAEKEIMAFRDEQVRLEKMLANERAAVANEYRLAYERQLDARQAELDGIYRSRSWRITRPLRGVTALLHNPKASARRLLNLLPAPVKQRLRGAFQRVEQWAYRLSISSSHTTLRQEMMDRRLALLAQGTPGWVGKQAPEGEPASWPLVSLSVVTYSSAEWLPALLESIVAQDYPLERLELLFVDNGSTDQTLAILDDFKRQHGDQFAQCAVHELPNPGFGAAHNHAFHQSLGDFFLVTNPDLEFESHTLARVVAMAIHDSADTASWEVRQAPFEHPKHYDPVSFETAWSSHACILIRRTAFAALGGYDERIFLYGEDVEFSFRCREAGWQLRYCPWAWVLHHTYEEAHQVKPAQYVGSTVANLFLRLRYGSRRDVFSGVLLIGASLLRSPFPKARKRLLSAYFKLLKQAPGLLRENRRHPGQSVGVFRGLDYEFTRHGAFVEAPLVAADQAPLVTVITRTYQGREWLLQQAGISVLQQSWPNMEWVVVEDGGEQCRATVDALAAASPVPVRYYHQPKQGRSAAGNLGLRMASGRWCVFLDDDDLLFADHIETLAGTLHNDHTLNAAYALSWDIQCEVDPDTPSIKEVAYVQHAAHQQPFCHKELSWRNFIPIQAIAFERRLFEQWGGFNELFDHLEDWDLWRRYADGAHFALVPKTTSLYRTPLIEKVSAARQALLDAAYHEVKGATDRELADRNTHPALRE